MQLVSGIQRRSGRVEVPVVKLPPIRHVHASGRFDQSVSAFEDGLRGYRAVSSLITVTEVDNDKRARELKAAGWDGVWGNLSPRDDCGISWLEKDWGRVWAGTLELSHRRYKNERGKITGRTAGAFAVLDHASGKRGVIASAHTPHGMQAELQHDRVKTDVALAYVSITRAYRTRALALARRHDADFVILNADWNLNVRLAWVRAWFRTYRRGTGLRLNWTPPYPVRGTHGHELIDATLYRGLSLAAPSSIMSPNKDDDHVAYLNVFAA